ncbi:MAG: response regulator [Patescibacteria group bacterium]
MDQKTYTVLLVEDETSVSGVLGSALERAGYTVLTATDGEEGLRLALLKHPDVILADLVLPRMGGLDMIRSIRKDSWGVNAEIIILTNVLDVAALGEAMNQNTFFYMIKGDSSMGDIIARIRSRIDAREARPTSSP